MSEPVDTSAEAVERMAEALLIVWPEIAAGPVTTAQRALIKEAAALLRALAAERAALLSQVNDLLPENDALRFERNNLTAAIRALEPPAKKEADNGAV